MGWNRNKLIDYSISIYNLNELLLNIPLLVYMPSNEQSIRVPLPTTRDNLKKYIDDDFILDGKSLEKVISLYPYWNTFRVSYRITICGFSLVESTQDRLQKKFPQIAEEIFFNFGI